MAKKPVLILASSSPRRQQLLRDLGLEFQTVVSGYREEKHNLPPHEFALKNAIGKAETVAENHRSAYIIGVDTIVSFQHHILEKAADAAAATKMLKLLSGSTHEVYTGVCVIESKTGKKSTAVEITRVKFVEMSADEIKTYVQSEEWKDKAGSFAIQGLGSLFIEKIEGDYFNVVGLPVFRLYKMFKTFGLDFLSLRRSSL